MVGTKELLTVNDDHVVKYLFMGTAALGYLHYTICANGHDNTLVPGIQCDSKQRTASGDHQQRRRLHPVPGQVHSNRGDGHHRTAAAQT